MEGTKHRRKDDPNEKSALNPHQLPPSSMVTRSQVNQPTDASNSAYVPTSQRSAAQQAASQSTGSQPTLGKTSKVGKETGGRSGSCTMISGAPPTTTFWSYRPIPLQGPRQPSSNVNIDNPAPRNSQNGPSSTGALVGGSESSSSDESIPAVAESKEPAPEATTSGGRPGRPKSNGKGRRGGRGGRGRRGGE